MRTALITPALIQGDLDYTAALPSISGPALNGLPVKFVGVVSKGTGYAIVSKPEIENVQGLKGRKFGINSFGASDDYTVYTFLSKSGLDPTRDVTLLSIGGTSARFAALAAGVVDAAAVSSPFEYKAEQSGLRILVPFKETAEHVNLSNAGLAATGPLSMYLGLAVYEDERFPEHWIFADKGEESLKTLIPGKTGAPEGSTKVVLGTEAVAMSKADRLYLDALNYAPREEEKRRAGRVQVRGDELVFEPTRMGRIAPAIEPATGFHVQTIGTLFAEIPPGKDQAPIGTAMKRQNM